MRLLRSIHPFSRDLLNLLCSRTRLHCRPQLLSIVRPLHSSRTLPFSMTTSTSTPRLAYPATTRSEHVDTYHGTSIPDPYDWLENPDSPATSAWVDAQNSLTQSYLSTSPDRSLLQQRLKVLYNYERYSCPFHRGARFFFFRNDGLQNQAVLYRQAGLKGEPEVLLDPNLLAEDGTAALGTYAFSEDGEWLAYGVSRSGSDWQSIELLRVADGVRSEEDVLRWVKFSSIAWTHDGQGFFYSRYPTPSSFSANEDDVDHKKGSETDKLEHHSVYYHRLHTPQSADVLVFSTPQQPKWMNSAEVTDDGAYLLLTISESTEPVNRLYYFPLSSSLSYPLTSAIPDASIVRLIDTFDNEYSYITNDASQFYFKTNLDAPRYRIIAADLAAFQPGEAAPVQWREVIPHREDVLTSVVCVNEKELVTVYMHDCSENLQLHSLQGELIMRIHMPDIGCVAGLSGRKQDSLFFYQFTSFLHPGMILSVELATPPTSSSSTRTVTPQLFRETRLKGYDASAYKTEQVWFTSKDGTKVPMFIISAKASPSPPPAPVPVHLYGYGGFNIALTPSFAVSRLIWMQQFQGIYVVANIRGGGEFGEEWHKAAVKDKKQNCFDDFIAAAESLIERGYTSPQLLAISGGSNGGLLVGACVNQRPDLFGAAVAAVGVLDMLKFHKFTSHHRTPHTHPASHLVLLPRRQLC